MKTSQPDAGGHFGDFGGKYIPETLMPAVAELEECYFDAKNDPEFMNTLAHFLKNYVGRPTPLTFASRLSDFLGIQNFGAFYI